MWLRKCKNIHRNSNEKKTPIKQSVLKYQKVAEIEIECKLSKTFVAKKSNKTLKKRLTDLIKNNKKTIQLCFVRVFYKFFDWSVNKSVLLSREKKDRHYSRADLVNFLLFEGTCCNSRAIYLYFFFLSKMVKKL